MSPTRKRETVQRIRKEFEVSERRACRGLGFRRSTLRYKRRVRADEPQLRNRILELVRQRPRFGYRRIAQLLRAEGFRTSNKRVHRIWRQEGLKVPKKTKKKRALGHGVNACHRHRATHVNHVWSWDFVFDRTESGQTLKWFVIVDEFTRRCITLDVSRGFKSADIIDRLSELFVMYGMPEHIRSDNGPEFIAKGIRQWLGKLGVQTLYIEPGNPWENGITESFNSRLSVLDGFSRYIVHQELRETMKEQDVELVIARGTEKHPGVKPRIISDNGPQFIAKDFREFVREYGLTHVRTSPYYPQSNGKLERWHGSLKSECIRPGCPATKEEAEKRIANYVHYYNTVRLHSAIGYITPADCLAGLSEEICNERDRKLEAARQLRQERRVAAKQVA